MGNNKYYCKINGVIENLKDIQDLINKNEFAGKITLTMHENHGWDIIEASTFEEVIKFNNDEIPADYNECLERMRAHNSRSVEAATANKPKCPTCGSTDIKKISVVSKAGSVAMFGLFSRKVHKQWHCNNCGSEW